MSVRLRCLDAERGMDVPMMGYVDMTSVSLSMPAHKSRLLVSIQDTFRKFRFHT